jgi:uncharacterized membrane protein
MFSWFISIILAYLFFSLSSFGDKLVLAGPPKPKLYTFYVGFLSILVIFLIPFVQFGIPQTSSILWILLEAVSYLLGLYFLYQALERFDVSRVIPAIGALQPVFILGLTWIFFGSFYMAYGEVVAFTLLLLGSILISLEKKPQLTLDFFVLGCLASLLFSLDYIFSKQVFLQENFFNGFIWMRLCTFLLVSCLLLNKKFRGEVFAKKVVLNVKTDIIFLATQLVGSVGYLLQSLAISLAPIGYLAIINSLRGLQYVFLFAITLTFSVFLPGIFKEKLSRRVVMQKSASILLIVLGLAILLY